MEPAAKSYVLNPDDPDLTPKIRKLLDEGMTPQEVLAAYLETPRGKKDVAFFKNGNTGQSITVTFPDTNYLGLFETFADFANDLPLRYIIEGIAQEQELTVFGGLSGHGKTFIMLAIVRSLLDGSKLFGRFAVLHRAERIIYLIPEVSRRSFYKRLRLFRLIPYIKGRRLLVRTLSKGETIPLTDDRLLRAAVGADVFLDTAVRFMEGDELSATDNKRGLAASIFKLLQAGARSVWGVHHSPKSFRGQSAMTLENVLRGSGDIGAMASNVYGVHQVDEATNRIHIECVKGRDLDEWTKPFQIEGRPWIDREGQFRMVKPPGQCGKFGQERPGQKAGRKSTPLKDRIMQLLILPMRNEGKSSAEILSAIRKDARFKGQPGLPTTAKTVRNWVAETMRGGGEDE